MDRDNFLCYSPAVNEEGKEVCPSGTVDCEEVTTTVYDPITTENRVCKTVKCPASSHSVYSRGTGPFCDKTDNCM